MLKWTVRVVLLLVVLLIAGGVVVYVKMDEVIRAQVEQQSTKQLNLGTSLAKADFKPLKGNLALGRYTIDNPAGFSDRKLLDLGGLEVQVGYSQLRQDPVRVESITIDSPRMLLEHKDGQFNLKAMVDRMGGGHPPAPAPGPTPPGPPQPPQPPQPQQPAPAPQQEPANQMKLIVGKITVKTPVVVLRPNLPMAGILKDEIEIPLETFTLENVGTDGSAQNGAAIKQVVTQLLTTMAAKAKASDLARQALSPELAKVLDGDLTAIAEKAIPGDAGKLVSQLVQGNVFKDPNLIKTNALGVAEQGLRNLGGSTTQPLGQVGNFAADALGQAAHKKDKDKEKKDREKRDREKEK